MASLKVGEVYLFLLLTHIWILGCGYAIATTQQAGVNFSDYETIAIAPFREFSDIKKGAITDNSLDWIAQHLRQKKYLVVESQEVQRLLELQNYSLEAMIYPNFITNVGEELKADAILMGTFRIYQKEFGDIELLVDIKLYDVNNGMILWSGEYHDIRQKGYAETLSHITNAVVEEIMDHFPALPG